MADIINRTKYDFPEQLVTDLISNVKGESSLAALCTSSPIPFNGQKEYTFNMDDEVDLVAEGGAKVLTGRGSFTANICLNEQPCPRSGHVLFYIAPM